MPGLADEIEAALFKPGPKCAFRDIVERLDAEDRKALDAAMRRWPKVQDSAIVRVLEARKIELTVDAVRRHRRRLTNATGAKCSCQG